MEWVGRSEVGRSDVVGAGGCGSDYPIGGGLEDRAGGDVRDGEVGGGGGVGVDGAAC